MFHTRRHLFDELDWIHPRYQRATGGLVSSHVLLNPVMRREVVATFAAITSTCSTTRAYRMIGTRSSIGGATAAGVDTSNFMEALAIVTARRESAMFLDWASR